MKQALVIDDSRAMRMILKKHLLGLGFEVWEAGHGLQALEVLQTKGVPDICLVDWNMPEMNGLEFLKAVRANGAYAGLRIMMVTSETEIDRMLLALEAGADEYVMKPFTQETIQEAASGIPSRY
jgi:two-component system, chemotaxis family, chemotaxis protein CheY